MSEADERPRPQYGEYATPDEQRAHTRQPPPLPVVAPAEPHPPRTAPTTVAARPTRGADRIITIVLLAYGLYTVVTALPQMLDYSGFAGAWIDAMGIDAQFTNDASGRLWGGIGATVFVVGWVATALLSWLSLSKGRLTWWIPLVGAVVTFFVVSLCLVVPLLTDPQIAAFFGL